MWNTFVEKGWVPYLGQSGAEKRRAAERHTGSLKLDIFHVLKSQKEPWTHESLEIDGNFGEGADSSLIMS